MRKMSDLRNRLLRGGIVLALVLVLFGRSAVVSHAESQGKITAASVVIRKEPSTSSQMIGSTERDKAISIVSQVKGADGYTWYKVYVDADTLGYIRSDLVTITDGTTPPSEETGTATPPPSNDPPTTDDPDVEPPAEVVEVNPVSGTVTADSVKILNNASPTAGEVAEVHEAFALTITGQATDGDGMIWYRVSFISNDVQVEGFVQSAYVHPSEDLVPVTANPPQTADPTPPPQEPQKQYDTIYANGEWQLYNADDPNNVYSINALLNANTQNQQMYEENQKAVKNQKIIIIILVFLLVAAVAGIAFLVFKVRDMMDSAYFSEVENETLRKRDAGRNQGGHGVMHTVGAERQEPRSSGARQTASGASQSQRPASASQGQRPASASQGQRPAGASQGQRPAGASQSQRPAGTSQGQRPAGASQGQRLVGASQSQRPGSGVQSQRPSGTSQGQKPAGAPQRPAGSASQAQRPGGSTQSQRPVGVPQGAKPAQGGAQKAQPKNFMADDEEFEFEFLNYDGDDEQ